MPSTTRRARCSSVAASVNWSFSRATPASSCALAPLGLLDLVEEHLERARRARQRAQHVEAHDVARSLPDRRQRRLAVQARHARLLDIAGAAEALERLERVVGGALAAPELADRGRQALEQLRVAVVPSRRTEINVGVRLVVRTRQAHRQRGRGLGLQAQVGEHVAHQRLVDQRLAERAAVGGVMCRADDARAHAGGGADHAVQARVADHLDDRRHAAAGLADHARPRAVELDLGRRVGVVAELVLQTLDVELVARAVGQDARQQEAGEAVVGLREHEEHVRHRRRAEPLVPDDLVLDRRRRRRSAGARRWCWRARRSRPASPSSPCPRSREPFSRAGTRRGSYVVAVTSGSHSAASSGWRAQRRHDREGHRYRAAEAGLGLHRGHVQRGARGVRGRLVAVHGSECSSCSTPMLISWCQAGWNSTSSMRCP